MSHADDDFARHVWLSSSQSGSVTLSEALEAERLIH
jgi:hypothetical protein